METRIVIASVGGQGGLTLSRVLAAVAVLMGYSVRTGETLGMSQRYGSVVSYVKIGGEVYSPLIEPGSAHYLIGLELLESLRRVNYLRPDGVALVADILKPPVYSSLRGGLSRKRVIEELLGVHRETYVIPATELAAKAGNKRAINMVMLGVLTHLTGLLSEDSVIRAVEMILPDRAVESSIKAYRLGFEYASSEIRAARNGKVEKPAV